MCKSIEVQMDEYVKLTIQDSLNPLSFFRLNTSKDFGYDIFSDMVFENSSMA